MIDDAELIRRIAVTLGRALTPIETEQATLWLGWARATIRRRLGELERLDDDDLAMVLVEAVALRLKEPDPRRTQQSRTVSVDDATVTTALQYQQSSGTITILSEWWSLLTPDVTAPKAFTIDQVPPRPEPTGIDLRTRPDLWLQWG